PALAVSNTRSWRHDRRKPSVRELAPGAIQATHPELGEYRLHYEGDPELLFTENESNAVHLWGKPNASPFVKDAFHAYIISGHREAINPAKVGTKAVAHYVIDVPGGGSRTVRLRLAAAPVDDAFGGFEGIFTRRIANADEFYQRIAPNSLHEDQRRVYLLSVLAM